MNEGTALREMEIKTKRRVIMGKRMTFALAFCNRGFMPGELIYGARQDMVKAVTVILPWIRS